MQYLSTKEYAEKLGISQRRVQAMCAKNQIRGVKRIGRTIAIPANIPDPRDKRYMGKER